MGLTNAWSIIQTDVRLGQPSWYGGQAGGGGCCGYLATQSFAFFLLLVPMLWSFQLH